MRYAIAFVFSLAITCVQAQLQSIAPSDYFSYQLTSQMLESPVQRSHSFFSPDKQQTYRPKSLLLMPLASLSPAKGENYWMGAMTTQSYNRGKLGTYYFWDVQGNLRESRMFLDIAGKNKRGLKLVFRRR